MEQHGSQDCHEHYTQTDRQTHTGTYTETDRQTDRQTYTDTQAEIHSKVGA